MLLVNNDSKLSDIVLGDPSVVTVFNRFGISLGVGDHTVTTMCHRQGLDTDFFITILNTYLFPDFFPEKIMESFKASVIIDYLNKTNTYYEQFQIPNIERHFSFLLQKSNSANSNLTLMMRFFIEVKTELRARIDDDRNRWFPEVLKHRDACAQECPIPKFDDDSDSIEDKIDDLINMFVIHLKGEYDINLCQAVLIALFSLKKDITQNNRIRNRILKPLSQFLATS